MKLNSILLLSAMALSVPTIAQTYSFQTLQEPYVELQGGTEIAPDSIWDDPEFHIELPFSFTIGDNVLDSIYVMDGAISSDSILLDFDDDHMNQTGVSSIIAVGSDLVDRAEHDGGNTQSPISYQTLIEDGKQVFVIEYKNAGFFDELIMFNSNDYINVQIRLIEDNSIEFHFGESNVSEPEEYFGNSQGNIVSIIPDYDIDSIGDISAVSDWYVLNNDPLNPDLQVVSAIDGLLSGNIGFNSVPPSGTKYVFTYNNQNIGQEELDQSKVSILNPVRETLVYANGNTGIKQVEIVNLKGEQVLNTSNPNHINVSQLSSGIYMVKFYDVNGKQSIQKMVKL